MVGCRDGRFGRVCVRSSFHREQKLPFGTTRNHRGPKRIFHEGSHFHRFALEDQLQFQTQQLIQPVVPVQVG